MYVCVCTNVCVCVCNYNCNRLCKHLINLFKYIKHIEKVYRQYKNNQQHKTTIAIDE